MRANTKLTKEQKAERKAWMQELHSASGHIYTNVSGTVTMVVMPENSGSRIVLATFAVASPNEEKIRRKVGEYHALRRMFMEYKYVKLPTFSSFQGVVDNLGF